MPITQINNMNQREISILVFEFSCTAHYLEMVVQKGF